MDELPSIRRPHRFRLVRTVLPVIVVLALAAMDFGAFVLHAHGWLRPISFELILVFIAIDIMVTIGLASMLVSLAILRDSLAVLLTVAACLVAAIGVTAFNLWCASMALLHAG
jgi:hypothetical protein